MKKYYYKRIDFCDEFCQIFPQSDENIIVDMKCAIASSHFQIDEVKKGDQLFSELIEKCPLYARAKRNYHVQGRRNPVQPIIVYSTKVRKVDENDTT